MEQDEGKICSICKVNKLHQDFYGSKNTGDGFQPYCKKCHSQKNVNNRNRRLTLKRALTNGINDSSLMLLIQSVISATISEVKDTVNGAPGNYKLSSLKRGLMTDFELLEPVLVHKYATELEYVIKSLAKEAKK